MVKAGLKINSGNPYLPWISIEDAARMILFAMSTPEIKGPINVVSRRPIRMADLLHIISKILKNKFTLPLNRSILEFAFGDALDEVVLASSLVVPKKIELHGYQYVNPDLEKCLRFLLGR